MAKKHTKGPWTFIRDGDYVEIDPVIHVYKDNHEGNDADYRLIAAAPELLAALELAFCAPETNFGKARDIALAAIAKARGTP